VSSAVNRSKKDAGKVSSHQGNLVVRAYPGGRLATQQFWIGIDAEIIGQVTTILRKLLWLPAKSVIFKESDGNSRSFSAQIASGSPNKVRVVFGK